MRSRTRTGAAGRSREPSFASCVKNGILGDFCFDANGDRTVTPVTILQAERPGRTRQLDTRGTDFVDVIDATQSLIR
jgi:hypothetical protein